MMNKNINEEMLNETKITNINEIRAITKEAINKELNDTITSVNNKINENALNGCTCATISLLDNFIYHISTILIEAGYSIKCISPSQIYLDYNDIIISWDECQPGLQLSDIVDYINRRKE